MQTLTLRSGDKDSHSRPPASPLYLCLLPQYHPPLRAHHSPAHRTLPEFPASCQPSAYGVVTPLEPLLGWMGDTPGPAPTSHKLLPAHGATPGPGVRGACQPPTPHPFSHNQHDHTQTFGDTAAGEGAPRTHPKPPVHTDAKGGLGGARLFLQNPACWEGAQGYSSAHCCHPKTPHSVQIFRRSTKAGSRALGGGLPKVCPGQPRMASLGAFPDPWARKCLPAPQGPICLQSPRPAKRSASPICCL